MINCKICNKKPVVEKGWFNIAAFLYPLCKEHFNEYQQFKKEMMN